MDRHKITYHHQIKKEMRKIPAREQKSIREMFTALGNDPHRRESKRLEVVPHRRVFRVPVGVKYRVIYEVFPNRHEVHVLQVSTREDTNYDTIQRRL